MGGASKYVKGNAVAGIMVTLINVIGGLIHGGARRAQHDIHARALKLRFLEICMLNFPLAIITPFLLERFNEHCPSITEYPRTQQCPRVTEWRSSIQVRQTENSKA